MREHLVNLENNFICGWYLENTSVCDEIIDFHKNSTTKHQGTISLFGNVVINKTIKDSVDVIL
jgi:hypothetical protein